MNLPYMTAATGKNRKQIIAFAGLNYGQGAGDGELAESWGLSSARFPCLSQRDGRKTAGTYTSPTGLYARGKLCVVDGTDFLYDGKVVGHVTAGEKQFATINTKIVIFPDKVYYDTEAEKFGMLAAEYPGFPGDVTFTANTLTVPEQSYIDQAAENAETKGSVAAVHDPNNPASGRVMQKAGMTREGMLRQSALIKGRFVDSVVYSILRDEWEAMHPVNSPSVPTATA